MHYNKELSFVVFKPENYRPILPEEKQRVKEYIGQQILDIANRFDGPDITFKIYIQAKGNA
jgi:hypothetical protein